jgi:hypothetical protein
MAAVLLGVPGTVYGQVLLDHRFTVRTSGEAVASITAGCVKCDWAIAGREAIALKLSLDGAYSQHVLLTRGKTAAEYRILLGELTAGAHQLRIERDGSRSAKEAAGARIGPIRVESFSKDATEYPWLATAPILHARPGTVERFSDVPLMMYVEAAPENSNGYRYTVIFSHEDGGTPTDRLMATWGRSTDIEFVYGVDRGSANPVAGEYQGVDHAILPFRGRREGAHPVLWVATDNNMFSDNGPNTGVRFAPAPHFVTLDGVSREAVMDSNPWLYEVMSAELSREGRIDSEAQAGSGKVADPRRFAYLEACGDVQDATIAFDIAVQSAGKDLTWHATDRGDARFRIGRSGCFRAAVPLPAGVRSANITRIRARVYTRPPREQEPPLPPGTGRVVLRRMNSVFMLDDRFKPVRSALHWAGALELRGESPPADIPATAR